MDRIKLLQARRQKLLDSGKSIRAKISEICDQSTFVEFDTYSFSRNEYYGEDAEGEGIVSGYAQINGFPIILVAQNSEILNGGLSLASCKKIVKAMQKSLEGELPILYLLDGKGVQVGEGVNVLEGIGEILDAQSSLRDASVPQIAVVLGEVYGSLSILASSCDFCYLVKGGCLSYASPLVLSASENKNVDKEKVGGASCLNGIYTAVLENVSQIKDRFSEILNIFSAENTSEDDYNRATESLNTKVSGESIISAVFDKDSFVELNKGYADQVITGIGFIGDTPVASIIFNEEKGVELTGNVMFKINKFIKFANRFAYPIVTFVNTLGIKQDMTTNQSYILRQIGEFVDNYKYAQKISVVYGYAVGLGYTLFASKALNNKYSFAFANAQIGLFNEKTGAYVELDATSANVTDLAEKYADNMDPINAAKNGYIDNIIEPKFIRQYLISALQTLEV